MDTTGAVLVAVLPVLVLVMVLLLVRTRSQVLSHGTIERHGKKAGLLLAFGPFLTFLAMVLLLVNGPSGSAERGVLLVVAVAALALSLVAATRWASARRR